MSSVFYREYGKAYPMAVAARGMYIADSTGKRYLDMSGGAAVSSLGHGHEGVTAAIRKQSEKLAFAHTAFFTNAPQEELSARLAARFGEAGAKVYYSCDGSEANETAMKIAWQYWRALGKPEKTIVISRRNSYHGNTLGALSVSGNSLRRKETEALLHDWPRIAPCYAYRHKREDQTEADYALSAARELEAAILSVGAEKVAAFICEPVVGASLGAVPAVPGYLKEIRAICDRYDILFIADEIMCGSGRCGAFFAHETDGALPDLVTLAKGLTGGYLPLGATIARAKIHDAFAAKSFSHGHTYIGHPLSCAAAVAVQDALDGEGLLGRVAGMGEKLQEALVCRFGRHENVGDIRGRGLFRGIELVADRATKAPIPDAANLPAKIKAAAMEEGLIVYPGGGPDREGLGPHILIAPPFIVEDDHIDEMCEKLERILKTVLQP